MRKVYRVENPITEHGMWYTKNGIYQPIINELCPNGISKDLPMGYNPLHKFDKKDWFSSGKGIENMKGWFSYEDITSLLKNGFQLYEFTVTDYMEQEFEVLFTRESIVDTEIIPVSEIWK